MTERIRRSLRQQDVRKIVGDLDDAKIAAILAIKPSVDELEEAVAWASGESDVMGELERPLDGAVAHIYDIMIRDETLLEDPE